MIQRPSGWRKRISLHRLPRTVVPLAVGGVKKGSERIEDVDIVVIAVGTVPNPLIASSTPQLKTTKWGTLVVDERGRTTMDGVWAGGDITSGGATVISAMGAGKIAAADMDNWMLNDGPWCEK